MPRRTSFGRVGGYGSRIPLTQPRNDADVVMVHVKEPAPSGPQLALRAFKDDRGRVLRAARLALYVGWKSRKAASHAVLLGGPAGTTPKVDLPRPQVCETCGGTASRPTTATPRERAPRWAGMENDIAELELAVKNKVKT